MVGLAAAIALCVAGLVLWGSMVLAPRIGWVDRPDARKPHARPVPPVGGIAWSIGLLAGIVLLQPQWSPALLALLASLYGMLLVGLYDDVRPLPSTVRLLLQVLLATLVCWEGAAQLMHLGALFGGHSVVVLGALALPFSVFALVGVINALNMADGMDGLVGMYASVTLLALLLLLGPGLALERQLTLLALVALLPFLAMNLRLPWQPTARVFFGDAGAMALGLLLGVLLIRGTQGTQPAFPPTAALWLFAVPLIDTVSVMLRRMLAGHSPFRPDQQHAHHLLLRAGFGVGGCWCVLALAASGCAAIGVWFTWVQVPQSLQALSFVLLGLCFHAWVCRSLKRGRLLGRPLVAQLSRV